MSDFIVLDTRWQVLLCLIGLADVFLFVYILLRDRELGRKNLLLPDALLLLFAFGHVQVMIRSVIVKPFYPEGRRLLTGPVIVTCLVLALIAAFLLRRISRWSRLRSSLLKHRMLRKYPKTSLRRKRQFRSRMRLQRVNPSPRTLRMTWFA